MNYFLQFQKFLLYTITTIKKSKALCPILRNEVLIMHPSKTVQVVLFCFVLIKLTFT